MVPLLPMLLGGAAVNVLAAPERQRNIDRREREDQRQRDEDAWRAESRDRQRTEWKRADADAERIAQMRQSMVDAVKPVEVAETPGAELPGPTMDGGPLTGTPSYTVGGRSFATMGDAQGEAGRQNSDAMRLRRQAAAAANAGDVPMAMKLREAAKMAETEGVGTFLDANLNAAPSVADIESGKAGQFHLQGVDAFNASGKARLPEGTRGQWVVLTAPDGRKVSDFRLVGPDGQPVDGGVSARRMAAGLYMNRAEMEKLESDQWKTGQELAFRERTADRQDAQFQAQQALQKQQIAQGWARINADKAGAGGVKLSQDEMQLRRALEAKQITPEEYNQAIRRLALGKDTTGGGELKPMNEGQAKSLIFGTRMAESDRVLGELAAKGVERSSDIKRGVEGIPYIGGALGVAANALVASPEEQRVEQAQRDFINATLRRESGAVISEGEFANAAKQYFPQIGDSRDVIAQKARNRELARQAMLADVPEGHLSNFQASRAAQQPAPVAPAVTAAPQRAPMATMQPSVNLGPSQVPARGQQPAPALNPQRDFTQAKAAIAKGLPPAEVARRLQAAGYPPEAIRQALGQ